MVLRQPSKDTSVFMFLCKTGLVLVLLLLPLYVVGEAFRMLYPWKSAQDPRRRILWDNIDSRSEVVLLGDSVFCSYYVDSPQEALWSRLATYTGRNVFPAALRGARPADILNETKRLPGGVQATSRLAFVDLIPTEFLPHYDRKSRYQESFRPAWEPSSAGLEALLVYAVRRPLLFLSSPEILSNSVEKRTTESYFKTGDYFAFVWKDRQAFSRGHFDSFKKTAAVDLHLPASCDFGIVDSADTILRKGNFRPVFVLTPLNRELIRTYSTADYASDLFACLDEIHFRLVGHLKELGTEYVDLTDLEPSEAFADMLHTNALGDDLMAHALADWLTEHPAPEANGREEPQSQSRFAHAEER